MLSKAPAGQQQAKAHPAPRAIGATAAISFGEEAGTFTRAEAGGRMVLP
jgi:hypothetical protein